MRSLLLDVPLRLLLESIDGAWFLCGLDTGGVRRSEKGEVEVDLGEGPRVETFSSPFWRGPAVEGCECDRPCEDVSCPVRFAFSGRAAAVGSRWPTPRGRGHWGRHGGAVRGRPV